MAATPCKGCRLFRAAEGWKDSRCSDEDSEAMGVECSLKQWEEPATCRTPTSCSRTATSPAESIPGESGRREGALDRRPGTRALLCAGSKGLVLLRSSIGIEGQSPAPDIPISAPCKALLQSPSHFPGINPSHDTGGLHPLVLHQYRASTARDADGAKATLEPSQTSCFHVRPQCTPTGRGQTLLGATAHAQQHSTHLCSSFRETVTLRLCPRRKRAARMSAHCTISPSGPPFSTRGLKTSPDSSVRKPIWIKIWRDTKRGQCWGNWGFPAQNNLWSLSPSSCCARCNYSGTAAGCNHR